MFEIELGEIEEKFGAERGLRMKYKALDKIVRPAFRAFNGNELEDILWTFKDPLDAVKGVLRFKNLLREYNLSQSHFDKIHVTGFGSH